MARKPKVEPEARHYEQAVDLIESFYPVEVFGRGDQALPRDLPPEVIVLIQAKTAHMARLTCENILRYARELAENE